MNNVSYRVAILKNNIEVGNLQCEDVRVKYDSSKTVKRACSITCSITPKMNTHKKLRTYMLYPSNTTFPSLTTYPSASSKYDDVENEFNLITDRLKVYHIINGVEKPVGVFMIISSPKTYNNNYNVYEFECYDETMKLDQNANKNRLFFESGTKYTDVISQLLEINDFNSVFIQQSDLTLQVDREFDPNTKYIEIVNMLLTEMNYNEVHASSNGVIMIEKKDINVNTPKFIYKKSQSNIRNVGFSSNMDIYNVPNVFVGVISQSLSDPIRYELVNDRFDSPLSTVNRGYEVLKYMTFSDIASEEVLQELVQKEFNNSLSNVETINFTSDIEAEHDYLDVIQFENEDIQGLFTEIAWEIDLGYDGSMKHTCERRVFTNV